MLGGQGEGAFHRAPRGDELAVDLGQVVIFGEVEPAVHVAEGVLVGHQFDKALAAVDIQGQDLFAGHGRGLGPRAGMGAVGKGVLGVELELVDLPARQPVDQFVQIVHAVDAVAADVEHHPARGDVGPVGGFQHGQGLAALLDDLRQGAGSVEDPGGVVAFDHHAAGGEVQAVALGKGGALGGHAQGEAHLFSGHGAAGAGLPGQAGSSQGALHARRRGAQRLGLVMIQQDEPVFRQGKFTGAKIDPARDRQEEKRCRHGD